MKWRMKIWILFFVSFSAAGLHASGPSAGQPCAGDSLLQVHYAREPLRQKYNDRAFQYEETDISPGLWQRFVKYVQHLLTEKLEWMNAKAWERFVYWVRMMFYLGILALGAWIFIRIYYNEGGVPLSASEKIFNAATSDEKIMQNPVSLPSLIRQAEQNRHWHEAVRYLFLDLLHSLDRSGQIRWKASKTNRDYDAEIRDPELRDRFRLLSRIYDYYWFGKYPLGESLYRQQIKNLFKNFNKKP